MTTPLSDERIAEIRAREQAATPGPWELTFRDDGREMLVFGGHNAADLGNAERVCDQCRANAWFAAEARQDVPDLLAEVERLRTDKDGAYAERDRLVAAMSKVFPAHLCRHPDEDTEWENDWRWIVCIHLPTGQVTWHIHDSERHQFEHLSVSANHWDGHTTEEKYSRLAALEATNDDATE